MCVGMNGHFVCNFLIVIQLFKETHRDTAILANPGTPTIFADL